MRLYVTLNCCFLAFLGYIALWVRRAVREADEAANERFRVLYREYFPEMFKASLALWPTLTWVSVTIAHTSASQQAIRVAQKESGTRVSFSDLQEMLAAEVRKSYLKECRDVEV